jgi:putative ABC transport system permease protein
MMLAWAEIRRSSGRFLSIIGALSLITFLVLTLSALSDGLFFGSTGAIKAPAAQAYVFSTDAEGSFIRSRLPADDVDKYRDMDGVNRAAPVGVLLTSAKSNSKELDVAVFGVDPECASAPQTIVDGRLPARGEDGVAAIDNRAEGVGIGSTVTVGDTSVEIVGLTTGSSYQLQPTLWTTVPTWTAMQESVRPETRGLPPFVSAVALDLDAGTTVASLTPIEGTKILTEDAAALAIPGVEQQRSTLDSIIYTTLLVAGLVVALFFALIVLEKRDLFAALKAVGTSTWRLGKTVIIQAVFASVIGVILGAIASRLLGLVVPAEVPTLFLTASLIEISIFTIVASVLGAVFSLRRIAKIDPATALGGNL